MSSSDHKPNLEPPMNEIDSPMPDVGTEGDNAMPSGSFYPPIFHVAMTDQAFYKVLCTRILLGSQLAVLHGSDLIGHDLANELGLDLESGEPIALNIYSLDHHVDTIFALIADIPFDLALLSPQDLADRVPPPEQSRNTNQGDLVPENRFQVLPAAIYPVGMAESKKPCQVLIPAMLQDVYYPGGEAPPVRLNTRDLFEAKFAIVTRALVDSFHGRTARTMPTPRQHESLGLTAVYAIELTVECDGWMFNIEASIIKSFPEELDLDEHEWPVMLEF